MLTNKIYPMNLVAWHNLGVQYLLTKHNLKEQLCIEHHLPVNKPKQNYSQDPKVNRENRQVPNVNSSYNKSNRENIQNNSHAANSINNAHNSNNINNANHTHNTHAANSLNTHDNNINQVSSTNRIAAAPQINNDQSNNAQINNIQSSNLQINNVPLADNRQKSALKPTLLPLHTWPVAWKNHLTNKNSAKVIWTYTGLGDDISGQGSPERKELIRRMIKELAFPTGTHAFWPLSIPEQEDQALNTQIFWSSAEILKARAIVIMGSTALNCLNLPRKLRPLQQTIYNGHMLIVLPDINLLVAEIQKYKPVRVFIKTALQQYVNS